MIIKTLDRLNGEGLEILSEKARDCKSVEAIRCISSGSRKIIIMFMSFTKTGNYNAEISGQLYMWNKYYKYGYCFDSNAGFTLPDGDKRSPDVSWISNESANKLTGNKKEKFAQICPDFVIEIRSKSDRINKVKTKMEKWINNGCKLAWLIDPEEQISYVYKLNNYEYTVHPFNEVLSGEDVLQSFELNMSEIKPF